MSEIRRKLVVVGDYASQKSELLFQFVRGYYPEYTDRPYENYSLDVAVDDVDIELALWDTSRK